MPDKRKLYRDLGHQMVDIALEEISEVAHDYVDSLFPERKPEFETAKEMRDREEEA